MKPSSRALAPLLLSWLLCGACTPAPPSRLPPAKPASAARPVPANLDKLVHVTDSAIERRPSPGHPGWSVPVALFPTSDPAWERLPERKLAVGRTGILLTGASDGSLLALDADGHPLFQLGVRGAVSGIEAQPDGGFAVYSSSPMVTFVAPDGAVREQPRRPDEPWTPTAAHRALRVAGPDGQPLRGIVSLVALSPTDVWALVRPESEPGKDPLPAHLFHGDGKAWTDRGVPAVPFPKEVFAEGHPAEQGTFVPHSLARSPAGALVVVGSRLGVARRASLLENTPQGLRERRDLVPALAKLTTVRGDDGGVAYAASRSGREVVCVSNSQVDQCVERGPDLAPRPLLLSQARAMPDGKGRLPSGASARTTPLLDAGDTLWTTFGWAGGDADVWAVDGAVLRHHDGRGFGERKAPVGPLVSLWGTGKGDLWITGHRGVARFDGTRFHGVLEIADLQSTGYLFVTGSGPDDVWVYGEGGLWHLSPPSGPEPEIAAALGPAPRAAAPSLPLRIGSLDSTFRLEKVELDTGGAPPLRHALHVSEGPGGLVWLHDGARLVEYDGARARVPHQEPKPEPFVCWSAPVTDCAICADCKPTTGAPLVCQRCAAPTQRVALAGDTLLRLGPSSPPAPLLSLPGLNAVTATLAGDLWAVSNTPDDERPHAVVVTPRGVRLVPGLPPAAYTDVAAREGDDVWLAGGLTSGLTEDRAPRTVAAGEGTLVHFDGKTLTRHRAPDGPLLSVAAPAPGEAWAVGVAGGLLHAGPGGVKAYHLERQGGSRAPVILRAVASAGPTDVWIAGDGATLLHGDGKSLSRVDVPLAGKDAAFSGIVPPTATRPGWLVGPSGIWKITRRP